MRSKIATGPNLCRRTAAVFAAVMFSSSMALAQTAPRPTLAKKPVAKRTAAKKVKKAKSVAASPARVNPPAAQMVSAKPTSDFVDLSGNPVSTSPESLGAPLTSNAAATSTAIAATVKPKSKRIGLKTAQWKTGLSGSTYANEKEQAQLTSFWVRGDVNYGLLKTLDFLADVKVGLYSSYSQSVFGDQAAPPSGISLKQAAVSFQPIDEIGVMAGAINQSQIGPSMLVDSYAFPGVLEKIAFGPDVFKTELKAEQAMPTSATMDTKAGEAEITPTFMAEKLTLSSQLTKSFGVSASGTHFAFSNLPSKVAGDSAPFGNTIDTTNVAKPEFQYGFSGYAVSAGADWKLLDGLEWTLDSFVIQNTAAADGLGTGQSVSSGLKIGLPGNVTLEPAGEVFFVEKDTAPAAYNDSDYGHNNHMGWAADLGATFADEGFKMLVRYVTSEPVVQTATQSNEKILILKFETLYDSLL